MTSISLRASIEYASNKVAFFAPSGEGRPTWDVVKNSDDIFQASYFLPLAQFLDDQVKHFQPCLSNQ